MKRYKYILCSIVLLLAQLTVHAQLLSVKIGSDALVEEAIQDAFVLVESNYCIQDTETNQKYGRNGKAFFNTVKFLGCKTDRGIITSETALRPWTDDNLFDKYRNNAKYKPLLDSILVVRSTQVDTIVNVNIASDLSFNNDSTLICTGIGGSRTDGLVISTDNKDAINWIVWVKSSNDESKDSSKFEYTTAKKTIDFSSGSVVVDTPNSANSFLGGLYISAKIISVGLVEFSLSGFVVENSGKWIVTPIDVETFTSARFENGVDSDTLGNDSDDDLTPVKEDGKAKKKNKAPKKK